MASRIIVRRKRYVVDYLNAHLRSIQSFQNSSPGQSTQNFDSPCLSSFTKYVSKKTTNVDEGDVFSSSSAKNDAKKFSALSMYRSTYDGMGSPVYQFGRQNYGLPKAIALKLQSIRHASTATARQPEYDDDEDGEVASKKRKETSPEECDQAVVGLSTAKAKVKVKLLDSQQSAKSVLDRVWATILGIGPAIRLVTSMSRFVSCHRCFFHPMVNWL